MYIIKESSCFDKLRWRINLEKPFEVNYFINKLTLLGYTESIHPLYPKIIEMKFSRDKHRIILVSKTKRIQLKLDIDSNESDRIKNAKKIALKLITAI